MMATKMTDQTSVVYPDTKIINKCLTYNENPIVSEGIFVVTSNETMELKLYDMEGDSYISIGKVDVNQNVSGMFAISPDFQRIAYIDRNNSTVNIIDANGKNRLSKNVTRDVEGVISWIGNNGLMLEKNDGYLFRNPYGVFFDIVTGELKEYQNNYPDIRTSSLYYEWGNYSFSHAVFNNDLTRVLYFYVDQNSQGIRLWDLINQKIISQWSGISPKATPPQWFRNSSDFIMGIPTDGSFGDKKIMNIESTLPYKGGYDLYKVNRDGVLTRLTYLTIQNPAAEKAITISPNEQLVAFWLNLNADSTYLGDLSILNIESGVITNLCISDDYGMNVTPIIWSPDSNYMVVSMVDEKAPHTRKVILIDLVDTTAYIIDKNIMISGWVISQ
jgi:hypothetical protein